MLVGFVLIGVALVDVLVGLAFVAPRAPEGSRPVLRAAFLGGASVMILLGAAFLSGWLGRA
ncbi:MAG: hypothetical protein U0167_19200 [bacterium]